MNNPANSNNTVCIGNELEWLSLRTQQILQLNPDAELPLPPVDASTSYGQLVISHQLTDADRVLLNLALATSFAPEYLFPLAQASANIEWSLYTGGFFRSGQSIFYPTVRTAVFLLSGKSYTNRSIYAGYFHSQHRLFTSGLIHTAPGKESDSFLNYEVQLNDQFLNTILTGESPRLDGGNGFPARRSKHTHTLAEVVLNEKTKEEIEKLRRFTRHVKKVWEINTHNRYRNNFISIFSGEPGTGKSHTAEALGNEFGLPVYKVNFAQMVSKYIGETEKNLEKIFDRFDKQPCILFFDEAEAVFSKRNEVKDSHDQHANNMQSYLLQKIEEFAGIVILATNVQQLSHYFDKAFQRRIRLIASFDFPDYPQRRLLWERSVETPYCFENGLIENLAKNYQLTGGNIYNIVSDAVLEAMDRETDIITFDMIEPAMKDEFKKTGRPYKMCTDEMVMSNPVWRYGVGYEQRKNF
ncbi:MAG: ATP-binding protein [Bacteroidia bacterium]|jgi:AAA+ superfamily predicted ATPase|nr:ATP-binding protein [Bacteroidia bacterium]